MKFRRDTIPAFLSIDVEPGAFQISRDDEHHWPGYAETYEFLESLRPKLAQASGTKAVFGWYFRMDPQIEQVCGRADVAMTAFPDRTDALQEKGDYFGVHTHPLRWCVERRLWIHEFRDRQWVGDSTRFALDAFAACTGSPASFFRSGAGFLCEEIVEALEQKGVVAELGLEPVAGWALRSKVVPSTVDSSPIVGESVNCASAPRTPYYPSREDFRKPGNADARRVLLIPLTTGPRELPARGLIPRLKSRLHGTPEAAPVRMLFPTKDDWTERDFWDVVSQALERMNRPYVSLAIRTDPLSSRPAARVCRVLKALTQHPLAQRLRFVNPHDVLNEITSPNVSAKPKAPGRGGTRH